MVTTAMFIAPAILSASCRRWLIDVWYVSLSLLLLLPLYSTVLRKSFGMIFMCYVHVYRQSSNCEAVHKVVTTYFSHLEIIKAKWLPMQQFRGLDGVVQYSNVVTRQHGLQMRLRWRTSDVFFIMSKPHIRWTAACSLHQI